VDYSARFGRSGDDRAYGIAVDSGTNVYLAGETLSADFPFTGSLKPGHGPGTWDGFAVKLDASAEFFHYAVCIGGKGEDRACGIGVDPMGCAYVAGATTSRDLPVRGKLPSRHGGGNWDAFVVKLTPDGRDTRYVMYFGGSNDDLASAIAVDAAGNAYVAGETASRDLPATNAVQPRHAGGEWDGFLLKLMGEDPAPVFATCFGGGGIDRVFSVAASAEGSAVIAGSTTSTNLPVVDAFQTRHAGGDSDGFVARFTPSGERLVCSTYLGGPNADALYGVAVDPSRGANFAGATSSTNLPTVNALQSRHFGGGLDGLAGKFPVDYSPEPPLRLVPAGGQPSGPSHDFFMGKYEVTNEEYVRFLNDAQVHTNDVLGANLYFDPEGSLWFNPAMQRQHHEIFNIRQSRILYHPDYPPGCRYNVSPLVPGVGGAYSNHPVVGVSWYGAVKYCNWLTIESGRGESQRCYREGTNAWDWAPVTAPATNWTRGFFSATERDAWLRFQGFRLPMDHCSGNESVPNQYNEFLKSASWAINTNTLYGFGRSKLEGGAANYLNHNPGLKQDTTPVGFFDGTDHGGILRTLTNENRYGIFDLSGNVDEWLNDPGLTNSLLERASCGGSWMFALPTLRNRHFVAPHFTDSFRGFRVMTVAPSPSLYLVRIPFFICVGACSPPSVKPPEKEPPGKPPLPPQEEARKPTTLTVKRLEQVGAMGLLRVPPPSIPAKKEEEVGRQQRGDAQMRSTQAAGWPNTGSSRPPRRAVGSVLSLRQRRLNLAVQYVPSKLVTPLESPGAEL
jgi:formylglycine-generating enzyme required for sulfatase activity